MLFRSIRDLAQWFYHPLLFIGCFAYLMYGSIGEALDAVLALAGPEDAVCAWGSLYSVGELRHCLGLC